MKDALRDGRIAWGPKLSKNGVVLLDNVLQVPVEERKLVEYFDGLINEHVRKIGGQVHFLRGVELVETKTLAGEIRKPQFCFMTPINGAGAVQDQQRVLLEKLEQDYKNRERAHLDQEQARIDQKQARMELKEKCLLDRAKAPVAGILKARHDAQEKTRIEQEAECRDQEKARRDEELWKELIRQEDLRREALWKEVASKQSATKKEVPEEESRDRVDVLESIESNAEAKEEEDRDVKHEEDKETKDAVEEKALLKNEDDNDWEAIRKEEVNTEEQGRWIVVGVDDMDWEATE